VIELVEALELEELSLFNGLSAEELEAIAGSVRRTTVPAATVLISAEMPGEAVYWILGGSVRVQVLRESGVELTLALRGPGDMVGEVNELERRDRAASVITREETTLLWMERRNFARALESSPALSRNLIRDLGRQLRIANERLQAIATLDVTGRVACQIIALAERYGRTVPGEGIQIRFPVTQGEIAELIAATRERVNQIMVRLRKAGIFSVDAEWRITVHRPDILAQLGRC